MSPGIVFLSSLLLAPPLPADRVEDLERVQVLNLKARLAHVQGIDVDGTSLWVTSVDAAARKGFVQEFALADGALLRTVEVQEGLRFHPGGMAAEGDWLWVPVAEYRKQSLATILKLSKKDLHVEQRFEVPDHIGWVAPGPDCLVGGNWDSRDIYVWDRQGRLQRKVPNPAGTGYQDAKFTGGQLVASGLRADRSGAIDWLDFPSFSLRRRMTASKTDRGACYTREGMTLRRGSLYLLPEDGESRLFTFRMPE